MAGFTPTSDMMMNAANQYWAKHGTWVFLEGDAAADRRVARMLAGIRLSSLDPAQKEAVRMDNKLADGLASADNFISHCMDLFRQVYRNAAVAKDVTAQELLNDWRGTEYGDTSPRDAAAIADEVNHYKSATPLLEQTIAGILNPSNDTRLFDQADAVAARLTTEFERELGEKRALDATMGHGGDGSQAFIEVMESLMQKLPEAFVTHTLKPRIPQYSAHVTMPMSDSELALYNALLTHMGHDPEQAANNAVLAKADKHWGYYSPDFIESRKRAEATTATGGDKAVGAYQELKMFNAPAELLHHAREYFNYLACDPSVAQHLTPQLLGDATALKEYLSAQAKHGAGGELFAGFEGALIRVLDPSGELQSVDAIQAATARIMQQVGLDALKAAGAISKEKEPVEREVAAKKAFAKALDGMCEQLPPKFVAHMLNAEIEHQANERGHDTRQQPETTVAGVLGKGKVQELGAGKSV